MPQSSRHCLTQSPPLARSRGTGSPPGVISSPSPSSSSPFLVVRKTSASFSVTLFFPAILSSLPSARPRQSIPPVAKPVLATNTCHVYLLCGPTIGLSDHGTRSSHNSGHSISIRLNFIPGSILADSCTRESSIS
ncbi:hypothetical protein XA68_12442 [Ophiocordyceps unilateralis]|uniref:Uncharacterized protein n=1 Tax=Ophiocordyceps unilateralis TaxID=268505 RepID=A0A2A9PER2_OPHUN|nr:hypothetical protein XA68_12442 [Ophiocordyceps unilateralis]